MTRKLPVEFGGFEPLTGIADRRRMLRAGGNRRGAGRAARSLDVSDGVGVMTLPTNSFGRLRAAEVLVAQQL
jgi:hypothetical protein